MSYAKERDEFIARVTAEGLTVDAARKLLRYASTLQRLAVAQCNGDWPYNGDRDRPSAIAEECTNCGGTGTFSEVFVPSDQELPKCTLCHGSGKTWHRDAKADERHERRYTVCRNCETSGVAKAAMRLSDRRDVCTTSGKTQPAEMRVCPDCRTQELVRALFTCRSLHPGAYGAAEANKPCQCGGRAIVPVFGGDPRGAVLRLSTPNFPYNDCGRNGAYGLYVPARER